ncbi:MAG: molybdenum cofactor guanylyltransferase [Actinomycetota bacterium]|nr:molybdenum cofactor guanylyltransferase [Actinomycetota bacterium]
MVGITGIILGGGRSSRIGKDKSFLKIGSKALFEHVLDKLSCVCGEIIVVTNTPQAYHIGNFSRDFQIIQDEIPYQGPLGGILAGLRSSQSFYNFVVACDMPFLNLGLMRFLEKETNGVDIIIPYSPKGLEPLHAIYSTNCIAPIQERLGQKDFRIISFFDDVRVKYIHVEQVKRFDPQFLSFFNVNTFQDLELARRICRKAKSRRFEGDR